MIKRPLCVATIAYIIGILIGLYLRMSIALLIILNIYLSFYWTNYFRKEVHKKKKDILYFTVLIGILLIGIMHVRYIDFTYHKFYEEISEIDENDSNIKATIISLPTEKEYSIQYKIKIVEINGENKHRGKNLILNVKKQKNKAKEHWNYGDDITISGKIEIPDVARNYGGFNYKQYLKGKKTYGTINSNNVDIIQKSKGGIFGRIVSNVQENIEDKIKKILPEENANLCLGILIGNREELSENITEDFKNSSLTHMLAVSGAHISYIILGLSYALNRIGKKNLI